MHAAQRKRLKIRISAVLISNIPSTSTSPCRLFVSFRCLLDLLLGKSFGHPGRRKRSLRVSALQSPVDVSSYPADDANTAEQVSGKREREVEQDRCLERIKEKQRHHNRFKVMPTVSLSQRLPFMRDDVYFVIL